MGQNTKVINQMKTNPQICVAFNAGSGGDFLVSLLAQNDIKIDNQGMVLNPPGDSFKKACAHFFLSKFKAKSFSNIKIDPIVNTHHCYQEIINLFPDCEFYFIDAGNYIKTTAEVYIDKQLTNEKLLDWLHKNNPFDQIKKIKNITDDQIKTIMYNDWQKSLNGWRALRLKRIDLVEIVDREKCRSLVKSMLKSDIDLVQFNLSHDEWTSKNKKLINIL